MECEFRDRHAGVEVCLVAKELHQAPAIPLLPVDAKAFSLGAHKEKLETTFKKPIPDDLEQLEQVPVPPFALGSLLDAMCSTISAEGTQSKKHCDKPVPSDLEQPAEAPSGRRWSASSNGSVSSDCTIAEWVASRPSIVSPSSITTTCSSEGFSLLPTPVTATTSGKSSKSFINWPRPTFFSFVGAAGAKLKKNLQAQFHRVASKERRTASKERRGASKEPGGASNELRGASKERRGVSKERSGASNVLRGASKERREASKESSSLQIAGVSWTRSLPTKFLRNASTPNFHSFAPIMPTKSSTTSPGSAARGGVPDVAIDDTTFIPAEIFDSLLKGANDRKGAGQHTIVSKLKPRLVLRDG